ncbi:hypothetical protein G6F23_015991 [Rhizopus arrhizus]|nr:hypothetical protein G6F23_015991 [Rhizopus arrhizus]
MQILFIVGVAVMVAGVGRPPQGTALGARGAQHRKGQLHAARGAEGAVGEIAVIETGQGEHTYGVQRRRDGQGHRRDTRP